MSNQKNVKVSLGGGFFMGLAIILMITGWAMESADYYPELGSVLFTIGFWLFVIPLIIVLVVLVIMIAIFASS